MRRWLILLALFAFCLSLSILAWSWVWQVSMDGLCSRPDAVSVRVCWSYYL